MQEDKYLKILQSLQAKGAAGGSLAAQLLQGAGLPPRATSAQRRSGVGEKAGAGTGSGRATIASDSDSDSDSDRSEDVAKRRPRRGRAGPAETTTRSAW